MEFTFPNQENQPPEECERSKQDLKVHESFKKLGVLQDLKCKQEKNLMLELQEGVKVAQTIEETGTMEEIHSRIVRCVSSAFVSLRLKQLEAGEP